MKPFPSGDVPEGNAVRSEAAFATPTDVEEAAGLRASCRRLLAMLEGERQQLARELHDDAAQMIAAIKFCSRALRSAQSVADLQASLDEIDALADRAATQLRQLSARHWPPPLESLGLEAALRWLVREMFNGRAERIDVDIDLVQGPAPTGELALTLFRIAQECLANILRHADARQVTLRLHGDGGRLWLDVRDDGRGFAVGAGTGSGIGLMRLRASLANGDLRIESSDRGSSILAVFPWP